MKILLVEDDTMIGESIQVALEGEGIAVDWIKDGGLAEAALLTQAHDALLLDLGLPHKDGLEVLRALRVRGNTIPVLVITARDTVAQRIQGLNLGADDYLIKPFDLDELVARLHALIRRARGGAEAVYRNGDVAVNPATRQVLVAQQQVMLSAREWMILDALVARPGAILSRAQLEERLYGWSGDVESNAVEVHIHGLRKKLGPQFIINVRGLGYMVEKT
ncbi:DNA-binding response regulator [Noviherbaspirillum cavernae]|uniref:DNA-binding response regulator n=1 Tax=Noviherbaspirillum cavernae TaxID=2320862 RepID=A0A418WXC0_9BURK|nr:response regulator transcription factor [Noviherbaspirillum cavernae]RJG04837.1 DNA-binding response regulator [Noviherbaspirillum cavernae]